MTTQRQMRVSDAERQAAADRLRVAMTDGRLDLGEYDDRLASAYRAVTYGDLEQLFADLPAAVAPARSAPARAAQPVLDDGTVGGMHLALKILWTVYGGVVLVNLTVWLLVGLGQGDPVYFWPMWLAVPGVVLTGATIGVEHLRRGRAVARRPGA